MLVMIIAINKNRLSGPRKVFSPNLLSILFLWIRNMYISIENNKKVARNKTSTITKRDIRDIQRVICFDFHLLI